MKLSTIVDDIQIRNFQIGDIREWFHESVRYVYKIIDIDGLDVYVNSLHDIYDCGDIKEYMGDDSFIITDGLLDKLLERSALTS